jgi:hypothetical protein
MAVFPPSILQDRDPWVLDYANTRKVINRAFNEEIPTNPFDPDELAKMLRSRLRGRLPCKVTHCHKLNDQKVVVFAISEGKAVVIEDDINLFPSDALVTAMRMLPQEKA